MRSTSFGEVLEAAFGDQLAQLSTVTIGKVTAWSSLTETVAVDPLILAHDGSQRPSIPQCPVVFPGHYWDIQIGETGLLLVCESDYNTWWRTGQTSAPATMQRHRIGNSVFLAGIRPQTSPRTHKTGAAIVDKPVALGEVLLGDPAATKAVLHEDFLSDLNTFLTALDVWGQAIAVATGVPWAGPQTPLNVIKTGISTGTYKSPSVKVEN